MHKTNINCPSVTPWKLVELMDGGITDYHRGRVMQIVDELADTRPIYHARQYCAVLADEKVVPGWTSGPTLWFEDHRGIELVVDTVARGFEYRSLALARDGDVLLISRKHDYHFEAYLRDVLKLGAPRIVQVSPSKHVSVDLAVDCLDDDNALTILVDIARKAGNFNIVPYRSNGHVWNLARRIAAAAQVTVHIASAVPPLAKVANNKLWFVEVARHLLGNDALPPTWSAHGTAEAAALLARLANVHDRLVLKTTSSAGSLGNVVFESNELRNRSLRSIHRQIIHTLKVLGWAGPWPVLIGVWESGVRASPSVQIWIPKATDGEPQIEGVYEQHLIGEQGTFVGATQSDLHLQTRIELQCDALQLALLLQQLGYVGRVSFDALLVDTRTKKNVVHWIECNARWGGVSIPMIVLRRFGIDSHARRSLIAQVRYNKNIHSFQQVLANTASVLYDRNSCRGVLWLTPPDSGRRSLDFIAVGATAAECADLAHSVNEALDSAPS